MPMSGQIALACSVDHSDYIQIVTRLYDHAQAVNAVVDANGGRSCRCDPQIPSRGWATNLISSSQRMATGPE